MKTRYIILPLLCMGMTMAAQESHHHHGNHAHPNDSSDVFFRHLNLNELVVTGVTGDTKLKNSTAPISITSTPLPISLVWRRLRLEAASRNPLSEDLATTASS